MEEWPTSGGQQIEQCIEKKEKTDGSVAQQDKPEKQAHDAKAGTESDIQQSESASNIDKTRPSDTPLIPLLVGVAYLLNPYSILACIAKSTLLLSHLGTVMALHFATKSIYTCSLFILSHQQC